MSNARDNIKAQMADEAQYISRTRIDLDAFLALSSDERAIRWRQWPMSAKEDAIRQQLMRSGYEATAESVAQWIQHYDDKYTAGPVERAVEGALEAQAIEHANAARLADRLGDKAGRKAERAAATAFSNALKNYKAGVRPEALASGAFLVPSSTPGKRPHLITMDGDWICNCEAGANWHWPLALVIGLEIADDHMRQFDDGDSEEEGAGEEISGSDPQQAAQQLLRERLEATAAILDAMRAAQRSDPPNENPLGDEEGDELPSRTPWYARAVVVRSRFLEAA